MSASRISLVVFSMFAVAASVALVAPEAHAQGCVPSRLNAPSGPTDPDGNSYYLPDGQWQTSFGYRHFKSHRHFVGDVEQSAENVANGTAERDRSTTEVVNHMNLMDLDLSYGLNDRLSMSLDLPIEVAHRSIPGNVFAVFRGIQGAPDQNTAASGIGDLQLMGRYWVAKPASSNHQNLAIGVGLKLPTGKDNVTDSVTTISATGAAPVTTVKPVDQSIQPGDGGFGFIAEIQGFKSFGEVTTYASGEYLVNPRETNGVVIGTTPGAEQLSVVDQFGARVGAGLPLHFVKGLGASVSARMEGVPSSDLIGGSVGFRRPGYSIGIEPGLSYSWRRNALSLSVPYLVHRDRTQSYADKLASTATGNFVNGDAAFADYIVIFGFSRRF